MGQIKTRDDLFHELRLADRIANEGVYIAPELLRSLDFENTYQEQIRGCFDMNHETYTDEKLPTGGYLSSNYQFGIIYKKDAPFSIIEEGGKYLLTEKGNVIDEITFREKPKFYNRKTSDGIAMGTVAQEIGKTKISVAYSNECSLKDKGLDCKFCNINATKSRFAELQGIEWKTPKQIAETIAEGYKEGFNKMTVRDLVDKVNLKKETSLQQLAQQQTLPKSDTKINIYAGTGENADLSNFAIRPFTHKLRSGGYKDFQSVEQAFQYIKAHDYANTKANDDATTIEYLNILFSLRVVFG